MSDGLIYVLVGFAIAGFLAYKAMTAPPPPPNPSLVCPHCQARGSVRSYRVSRKQGISGGKATGALMTGGLSMFATGLSRKQGMTHMECSHCGTGWDVA